MNAHCGTALFAMLFSFASAPAFRPRLLQRLHSSQLGRVSLRRGPALLDPMPASLRLVARSSTPDSVIRAARGIPLLLRSCSRPAYARLPLIVHAPRCLFPFSGRAGLPRFAATIQSPTVLFRADLTPSSRVACRRQSRVCGVRDPSSISPSSPISSAAILPATH